jgi:hypothetical protein
MSKGFPLFFVRKKAMGGFTQWRKERGFRRGGAKLKESQGFNAK